ncbi:MAG: hypothetical protein ABI882_11305 [Acidobacteriota bacterium]
MIRNRNRLILIGLVGAILLTGFAFGRITGPETANAFNEPAKVESGPAPSAVSEAQTFYLSDFKTGYGDGFANGLSAEGSAATATTTRAGYNDGFKQGFAAGYESRVSDVPAAPVSRLRSAPTRERVVYRSVERERPVLEGRKKNSTLKTVLTIAVPAALGAGVGGAIGGKKGAGVGALLGGGGGGLYHLIKNK